MKVANWGNYLLPDTIHLLFKGKLEDLGFEIKENLFINDAIKNSPLRSNVTIVEAGLKGEKKISNRKVEFFLLEELINYKLPSDSSPTIPLIAEMALTIGIRTSESSKSTEIEMLYNEAKSFLTKLLSVLKYNPMPTSEVITARASPTQTSEK